MSCPRTREIEADFSRGAELDTLRAHARECAECGRLLAKVESAYRLLRSEKLPGFSPQRRAELVTRLGERPSPWGIVRPALGAAAAALVVLMVAWPMEQVSVRSGSMEVANAENQRGEIGESDAVSRLDPVAEPELSPFLRSAEPQPLEASSPRSAPAEDTRAPQLAGTADRAAIEKQRIRRESSPPELDVKQLLGLADRERRKGDWSAAEATYARVAEHPRGAPYAEEALFRRAQILAAQELVDRALAALAAAERRFPMGTLATERAVLEAQLCLKKAEAARAADAIERAGDERTPAVLRTRVDVAEVLVSSSPDRARRLLQPVFTSKVSGELIARARVIDLRAGGNE